MPSPPGSSPLARGPIPRLTPGEWLGPRNLNVAAGHEATPPMNHARLLLCASLVLTSIAFTPTGQAVNTVGTFTTQIISGGSGQNHVWISADGSSTGNIGIAFERATSGDVGFASGNYVDGFTVKTNDIDPTETSIKYPYVLRVSDTTWFIAATTALISGTEQYLYKTTNSGTTWTQIQLVSGLVNCLSYPTLAYQPTTNVLLWTRCQTATFGEETMMSTDLGVGFAQVQFSSHASSIQQQPMVWAGVDSNNFPLYEIWTNQGLSASGPNRNLLVYSSSGDGVYWSTPVQKDGGGACGNSCTAGLDLSVRGEGQYRAILWDHCDATGCSTRSAEYSNDGTTFAAFTGAGSIEASNACQSDALDGNFAYSTTTALYFSGSQGSTPANVLTLPSTSGRHCTVISGGRLYLVYSDQGNGGQLRVQSAEIIEADANGQTSWCSNIDAVDFGYNYILNVQDFDGAAPVDTISLSDGYHMEGTSGSGTDLAYMGKGWAAPGTPYAKVVYRIEAATEGRDSTFRAVFSLDTGTPDATSRGNGLDTGSFADHVEAAMTENGAFWQLSIKYSNGGSARASVGSSVNVPFDPNDAHTYSFTVDTRGNGYAMVKDEDGNQVLINRTMSTSGLAGFAAFAGSDPLYSQWFVSSGSNAVLDSDTYLDDSQDTAPNDEDSTCIFFTTPSGTEFPVVVEGDQGTEPPSLLNITGTTTTSCDSFLCTSDDNVPEGFTAATFNFFLGLLMTIAVAAGFWFLSKSPLIMGVGALVGYLMAWAFGLVALWPLVLIAVLGVAVIFLKARPSGG